MTHIKPITTGLRNFTAGKLVKRLQARNINYERSLNNDVIKIKFNNGNAEYTYNFSNEDALILSKKMDSKEKTYETVWDENTISFRMFNKKNSGKMTIKKTIHIIKQSLFERIFSRTSLQDMKHTRITKNVIPQTPLNPGYTKDVYDIGSKTQITDMRAQLSYKVRIAGNNGNAYALRFPSDFSASAMEKQLIAFRKN